MALMHIGYMETAVLHTRLAIQMTGRTWLRHLLFQGLLTARAYFKNNTETENKLRSDITRLWKAIDWNWFRKESSENALYWH